MFLHVYSILVKYPAMNERRIGIPKATQQEAPSTPDNLTLPKKLEVIQYRSGEILSPTAYKILEFDEAEVVTKALKSVGKNVVLVSGVFDLLHTGHLNLFENARSEADILAVATPTDQQIKENKNSERPVVPLEERMRVLSSIEFVDFVFPQNSWLMMEVLAKIKPSIYAVWENDEHMVSRLRQAIEHGIDLRTVKSDTSHLSSTKLLHLINKLC